MVLHGGDINQWLFQWFMNPTIFLQQSSVAVDGLLGRNNIPKWFGAVGGYFNSHVYMFNGGFIKVNPSQNDLYYCI